MIKFFKFLFKPITAGKKTANQKFGKSIRIVVYCYFTPLIATLAGSKCFSWGKEEWFKITPLVLITILPYSALTTMALWLYTNLYNKLINHANTFFQPLPAGIILQIIFYGILPGHFCTFILSMWFFDAPWNMICYLFGQSALISIAIILLSLPFLTYHTILKRRFRLRENKK